MWGTSMPPNDDRTADATMLLDRMSEGDAAAAAELLPIVYAELRARAGAYFRGQPAQHTLEPTALVHEAYVKLVKSQQSGWNSRAHFCAVAATAMRQILIDHARRRALGQQVKEERAQHATDVMTPDGDGAMDIVALDKAMQRLAERDADDARLVELRFFGGLTNEAVADVLETSLSSVERRWRRIRAWLALELSGGHTV